MAEKDDSPRAPLGWDPVEHHPPGPTCPNSGSPTRKQIAALVGVAPLRGARGGPRGKRTIWGGRAQVRTTLYMEAWRRHDTTL